MRTYKVHFMEIATYPHLHPDRTGYRLAIGLTYITVCDKLFERMGGKYK